MKMYSLSCKNMGIKCNYVATGESREEVMDMMKEHLDKSHPKESKNAIDTMSEEEIEQKMMENIVEKDDENGNEEEIETTEDLM